MKKTNKENPITFFRKANEARQKLVKKSMGGPGNEVDPYSAYSESGPKEEKAQADYDLDNKSKTKGYSNVAARKQWDTGTVAPYTPIKKKGGSVKRKKK
jgi:hypothetical protein